MGSVAAHCGGDQVCPRTEPRALVKQAPGSSSSNLLWEVRLPITACPAVSQRLRPQKGQDRPWESEA